MTTRFELERVSCLLAGNSGSDRITYIIYPMAIPADRAEDYADRFGTSVAVITGMDWQDALTPWPAKGVPRGTPDFRGKATEFLAFLRDRLIPEAEKRITAHAFSRRDLIGVSLSGLFTLWHWLQCDTFTSIASLSGSFWYDGFVEWVARTPIPPKTGKAFFLLGDDESRSRVPEFSHIADDTGRIIGILRDAGIDTEFASVPGNHYSDPDARLERALAALRPSS